MKYTVNLFGFPLDGTIDADNHHLAINFAEDELHRFKTYLQRVLPKYTDLTKEDTQSINRLIQRAIEAENSMGGRMSEPTIKLPYEVTPEIKEKLVQSAAMQGTSATQLLIRIIESKYHSMINA
ncbi:MAG: hypothetical protein WDZ91_15895 [Paenibacillaceae bacterium]